MPETFNFVCEESGVRLDRLICDLMEDVTRSAVQRLIDDGNVKVNSTAVSKNYKSKIGDKIEVFVPDAKPLEAVAQNIPLDIVYEDDDLLVVNKPKGMVVHPANGNPDGTLVNALLYHCGDSLSGINGVITVSYTHLRAHET